MQNFKINAQVCKYSLSDLNIGHCIELTFLDGKLDRSLMVTFFKLMHFESEGRNNSEENCFQFLIRFLDPYHKKTIQLALKEGQFYTMV